MSICQGTRGNEVAHLIQLVLVAQIPNRCIVMTDLNSAEGSSQQNAVRFESERPYS